MNHWSVSAEYPSVPEYFYEAAMRMSAGQLIFETASYQTEQTILTTLTREVLAITTLLLFANQLYLGKPMQAELDFYLGSNGKLVYMSQNSQLKIMNMITTPVLDPSPLSFSKVIRDVSDAMLNDVYRNLLHGFVTEGQPGYFFPPFIDLNEQEQNPVNAWFRAHFSLSLQDLDD